MDAGIALSKLRAFVSWYAPTDAEQGRALLMIEQADEEILRLRQVEREATYATDPDFRVKDDGDELSLLRAIRESQGEVILKQHAELRELRQAVQAANESAAKRTPEIAAERDEALAKIHAETVAALRRERDRHAKTHAALGEARSLLESLAKCQGIVEQGGAHIVINIAAADYQRLRDYAPIQCARCGDSGHIFFNCPTRGRS